jgi:hypothetical protein
MLGKIASEVDLSGGPWADDLLERRQPGITLVRLIQSLTQPYVIAVHGDWGSGKSVFLKRVGMALERERLPVVHVDAWRNDLHDDPLFALLGAMSAALDASGITNADEGKRKELFGYGAALIKPLGAVAAPAINLLSGGLPVGSIAAAILELGSKYLEAENLKRGAHESFEKKLEWVRDELLKSFGNELEDGGKVVIVIDELDRCKPSYAISMLERVKHLFDLKGFVFLIATDGKNLPEAVRSVYGGLASGEEYLRRFFDFEFRIPLPNPMQFGLILRNNFGFELIHSDISWEVLKRKVINWNFDGVNSDWLDINLVEGAVAFEDVAKMANMSLRDQAQAFAAMCAIIRTSGQTQKCFPPVAAYMAAMRFFDRERYENLSGWRNLSFGNPVRNSLDQRKFEMTQTGMYIQDFESILSRTDDVENFSGAVAALREKEFTGKKRHTQRLFDRLRIFDIDSFRLALDRMVYVNNLFENE